MPISRPQKYLRIGGRPQNLPTKYLRTGLAPGDVPSNLDSVSDVGLFSQEDFSQFATVTGGPTTLDFTPGIFHRFIIPPGARRHFFWIAAGAYLQQIVGDIWWLQGRLNFSRAGRPVGAFDFCDADPFAANSTPDIGAAVRRIVRIRADGSGSVQPVMRYQVTQGGGAVRDNLDIACFSLDVLADRVEYEVLAGRIRTLAGGSDVRMLTGAKIISVP